MRVLDSNCIYCFCRDVLYARLKVQSYLLFFVGTYMRVSRFNRIYCFCRDDLYGRLKV